MQMLKKGLLAMIGYMLLAATTTQAQNDTWLAVMSDGDYPQGYSAESEYFPNAYIDTKWKEGMYITDITYSPSGWRVVMSQAKYSFQRWKRSATFPSDFIELNWKEGMDITKVAYGNGEWVVVMSKGAGYSKAVWGKRQTFDEMTAYIKQYWASKDIVTVAYGDGSWVIVMANGAEYDQQLYNTGIDFPTTWVQEKYKLGYNITSVTYGEGKWFVVLSKLPVQRKERYTTLDKFPVDYVKAGWNEKRRVLFLHYNYDKKNSAYYEDYYNAGIKALETDDYDEAIEAFTQALRIDNTHADAYNNLAWSKYLAGQCQGGLADINKALTITTDEFGLHTRGSIYFCLGRCREAVSDFDKALSLAANKEAYLYGDRGRAHACLGNYSDALKDLNKALQLDPTNQLYKQAKADVEANNKKSNPPTITWDYPYNAFTSSTANKYDIKACIHSEGAAVKGVRVLVNGKDVTYASRGFAVEEDCDATVSQAIALQNGTNEVQIVVTTDQNTTHSEKRTIEYKTSSGGDYHALLIGVSSYEDMSIKDLTGPTQDVRKLRDVLTQKYTFNAGDVHVLENPSKEAILNKLVYLQERLGEKDNLMIFYAGHGIVKNEVGYWLPSDANKENRVKWLSNAELRDYVHGMKAKHVLVVADACFSGSIISGSYRDMTEFACMEMAKIPSRRAMTSGANTVVPDESVFFDYFIKKLEENSSGCFTAEDLYTKVKPAVINNSPNQQIPQFGVLPQAGDEGGNFIFKRR